MIDKMLNTRVYYILKPFIPLQVRLAIRQRRAAALRKANAATWPIDERAGATPPHWPGWPDGKRFALVLTHDVESQRGINRIAALMQLEEAHGVRSSFNLVAEGSYRVSEALRRSIQERGFEVGIHGLKHDGKKYSSKRVFAQRAKKIREHAREWGVSGFRSPLMQHELSWLHALGMEYDLSTFDTDPFEPQPDGTTTIFPFWVPGPAGSGYVELPYTVVQDFNLFIVLGDTSIDVWKQKVDWIAERGGMVLVNTHPDYMAFGKTKEEGGEYPVSHYDSLLTYVRTKFVGQYWPALPRDVASYYKDTLPAPARNTRKKICMLTYSNYDLDTRVRRYAETLAARGDDVDVIAISGEGQGGKSVLNGVHVDRIQTRELNERGQWHFAYRLTRFLLLASWQIAHAHRRKKYDLIHVHNMPDFLVFASLYPKLTRAKLVLDIHDLTPEFYLEKFSHRSNNRLVRLLYLQERVAAALCDHIIVSNHLWQEKVARRCGVHHKCSVFLNHIDRALFWRHGRDRVSDRFVLLFPGTWQPHQGLDVAIKAVAHLRQRIPNVELHIYGSGPLKVAESLRNLTAELGVQDCVKFCGNVPVEEVAELEANADVGVVPKLADSFGNEAYSTKIMEFMSQGLPVVASRTKIDSYYFDDGAVEFFPSGDAVAMAEAILRVKENDQRRLALIENGLKYAEENSWEHHRARYLELVDTLTTEVFGIEDVHTS